MDRLTSNKKYSMQAPLHRWTRLWFGLLRTLSGSTFFGLRLLCFFVFVSAEAALDSVYGAIAGAVITRFPRPKVCPQLESPSWRVWFGERQTLLQGSILTVMENFFELSYCLNL